MNPLTAYSAQTPLADNWTAEAFAAAAHTLGSSLKAQNVRRVGLWFDDAARFACALLAVWHADAQADLLPNTAADTLAKAAEQTDLLISDQPDLPFSGSLKIFTADDEHTDTAFSGSLNIPEHARLFLYTSGSGGEAKRIEKTAAALFAEAAALRQRLPENWHGLAAAGSVTPQHMYGLTFRIFTALACGWRFIRRQHTLPEALLAASSEPVVWIASPAVLNRLNTLAQPPRHAANVRGILSAGGMLPEHTAQLLQQTFGHLPVDIYGSTESGVMATRQGSGAWTALPEVQIQAAGDGLDITSPWSGGTQHMADAAEFAADGSFVLLGRSDRIIKLADKRLSPAQIEHALLQHPAVADAHCGSHPQHGRIAAWIALSEQGLHSLRQHGRAALIQQLRRHLAQSVERVALPRYWRFAATLPRNAQAKIRQSDFQAAFELSPTAPLWQPESRDDVQQRYTFSGSVPADLRWFGGHFAEFPLVPGVIEIQWARDLAAQFDWGRRPIAGMENLKYQQFVRPGDQVLLTLQYDAAKQKIHFTLQQQNGAVCAGGRLVLAQDNAA